jgi:hypothetical protein
VDSGAAPDTSTINLFYGGGLDFDTVIKDRHSQGLVYHLKYIKTLDGKVIASFVQYAQAKVAAFKQSLFVVASTFTVRSLAAA